MREIENLVTGERHLLEWSGVRLRIDPARRPCSPVPLYRVRLTHEYQARHHVEMPCAETADDGLWFKDAVIYQLHVKAFRDSNGDGVGDFAGLTERLDYLRDLGVTTLWLLPFYPEPWPRRRLRHFRLRRHQSRLRHDAGFPPLHAGGQAPRPARHHRAGHQSHIGPARLVQARQAQPARTRARATGTSGATPTRNTRARASSSPTPRSRTGPGMTRPMPFTGTASSRISRT